MKLNCFALCATLDIIYNCIVPVLVYGKFVYACYYILRKNTCTFCRLAEMP